MPSQMREEAATAAMTILRAREAIGGILDMVEALQRDDMRPGPGPCATPPSPKLWPVGGGHLARL